MKRLPSFGAEFAGFWRHLLIFLLVPSSCSAGRIRRFLIFIPNSTPTSLFGAGEISCLGKVSDSGTRARRYAWSRFRPHQL